CLGTAVPEALADETCNSPYISNLIKGQEDFVHVWTLGVEGLGDGSDKLVTVDANPASKTYGKVVDSVSVGGRGEAHHMGFTDDRKLLWAGGLDERDPCLRRRHQPVQAEVASHHHRLAGQHQIRRSTYILRAAGTDA